MDEHRQQDIRTLMEIAGLDYSSAESILGETDGNLEEALNLHLELTAPVVENNPNAPSTSGSSSLATPGPSTSSHLHSSVEPIVRAPIPPRREQLLLPGEDQFRFRKRRNMPPNVDPFRNFVRESELQEQNMAGSSENFNNETSGDDGLPAHWSASADATLGIDEMASAMPSSVTGENLSSGNAMAVGGAMGLSSMHMGMGGQHRKRSRLADLFFPPTDLCFWGTFFSARDHATAQNRWLIINIQDNAQFMSQVLNRDIWSNPDIRTMIKKYFVLWQTNSNTLEGARFTTFYSVNDFPYIGIVDPRTGELRHTVSLVDGITANAFVEELLRFLRQNGNYPHVEESVVNTAPSNVDAEFRDLNIDESSADSSSNGPHSTSIRQSRSGAIAKRRLPNATTVSHPALPSTGSGSHQRSPRGALRNVQQEPTSLSEDAQLALAIRNSLLDRDSPAMTSTRTDGAHKRKIDGIGASSSLGISNSSSTVAEAAANVIDLSTDDSIVDLDDVHARTVSPAIDTSAHDDNNVMDLDMDAEVSNVDPPVWPISGDEWDEDDDEEEEEEEPLVLEGSGDGSDEFPDDDNDGPGVPGYGEPNRSGDGDGPHGIPVEHRSDRGGGMGDCGNTRRHTTGASDKKSSVQSKDVMLLLQLAENVLAREADAFNEGAEKIAESDKDLVTKIALRLPNGDRELSVWPSSTKLRSLLSYIAAQYPAITKEPYKIMCPHLKIDITQMSAELTFLQAKLHPSSLIYLHLDE